MSCNDTNPCDPCIETNPCYEDCGCLNPTTFACITKPGTQTNIDVTNDMNGLEVLNAINTKVGELVSDIANIVVPIQNTADTHVKVSATDTTTGYLDAKIEPGNHLQRVILNPAGVEKIRFNVTPSTLISSQVNNTLALGPDGKLSVLPNIGDGTETKLVSGAGIVISGLGSTSSPYIISTNPSIQAARSCFDGVWNDITVTSPIVNTNVTMTGTPQYRVRFDGSIEFRGTATFNVTFEAYSVGNAGYKQIASIGSIPTSCVTLLEQTGVSDLKSINYILAPVAGAEQIVQQVGYIIRKSAQNLIMEFTSSLTTGAVKTIVVNFDGAVSHPIL